MKRKHFFLITHNRTLLLLQRDYSIYLFSISFEMCRCKEIATKYNASKVVIAQSSNWHYFFLTNHYWYHGSWRQKINIIELEISLLYNLHCALHWPFFFKGGCRVNSQKEDKFLCFLLLLVLNLLVFLVPLKKLSGKVELFFCPSLS